MRTCFLLLFFHVGLYAQYAPPAGQPGSTAIWRDSSIIVNWATQCTVVRGWQNISDTTLGKATVGNEASPTGKPGANGVLSLGDGGYAVCTFEHPIRNGSGFDFAVFENSFDGLFLELAFVEVSSNGIDFFRFPAHSLTDTTVQKGTFDLLDATQLNNLAGKYQAGYGTPFDLEELAGIPQLNINNITHVKVIDVVGSLNNAFATHDAFGNKINDPFPTPFESGGFDLDAIGVIHQNFPSGVDDFGVHEIVYPNPVRNGQQLFASASSLEEFSLMDLNGKVVAKSRSNFIDINALRAGVYFLKIVAQSGISVRKIVVQ